MVRKPDSMDRWIAERRGEHRNRRQIIERAAGLGITAEPAPGWGRTTLVMVTSEQLAAICDRLEKRDA